MLKYLVNLSILIRFAIGEVNFQTENNLSYHESSERLNFNEAIKYCFEKSSHLLTLSEAETLEGLHLFNTARLMSVHGLFTRVYQGNMFDLFEGDVKPDRKYKWLQNEIRSDEQKFLSIKSTNELKDVEGWRKYKILCIKNTEWGNVYPDKKGKILRISANKWPLPHDAKPMLSIDTPTEITDNKSFQECYLKCIKSNRCKSIYHSEKRQLCVQKLYIDAPLNKEDSNKAPDFQRYSFEILRSIKYNP